MVLEIVGFRSFAGGVTFVPFLQTGQQVSYWRPPKSRFHGFEPSVKGFLVYITMEYHIPWAVHMVTDPVYSKV